MDRPWRSGLHLRTRARLIRAFQRFPLTFLTLRSGILSHAEKKCKKTKKNPTAADCRLVWNTTGRGPLKTDSVRCLCRAPSAAANLGTNKSASSGTQSVPYVGGESSGDVESVVRIDLTGWEISAFPSIFFLFFFYYLIGYDALFYWFRVI